jgi:hypothetical protein
MRFLLWHSLTPRSISGIDAVTLGSRYFTHILSESDLRTYAFRCSGALVSSSMSCCSIHTHTHSKCHFNISPLCSITLLSSQVLEM